MSVPQQLTVEGLLALYRSGETTPREVIGEIVRRSRETADYNIWIVEPSSERIEPYLAVLEAMADEDRAAKPLWGIPFAVKDNIDLAGVPTTAGCPAYAYTPSESATVVSLLIEAGAIPVGKTNLDQFATGLVGTRSPYGECHNALDPKLISGGSSSGSAVSVALGMAAFALGTDTAGSGRVPAALNDLVGFKPPLGSWSTKGVVPACASLDCVTVFANTLADALAVDSIASCFDSACAWSRSYAKPEASFPATIYLPTQEPRFYGPFEDEYRRAWHGAVARLRCVAASHGSVVAELDTAELSHIASILYDGPWVAERWADLGGFVSQHGDDVFPVTRTILESGNRPDLTAADMFDAYHEVSAARTKYAQLFADAVLVMPTAGGTFTRDEVRQDPIATNSLMGLYTNHCNLSDLAAIAVPAGWAADSLPFGITAFTASTRQGLLEGFAAAFADEEPVKVAVCGQHMRGLALHGQLEDLGAVFIGSAKTATSYRLFALPTDPVKPGLLRCSDEADASGTSAGSAVEGCGGEAGDGIEVEVYLMSKRAFGELVASTPSPLGFGTVELADGTSAKGFLVESSAVLVGNEVAPGVEEITVLGSFKAYLDQR